MKISVLGAGAWGTALARSLIERDHEVTLWTWQPDHAAAMKQARENVAFFPGHALPENLAIEADLGRALEGAELFVLAVPSPVLRATLRSALPFLSARPTAVIASKGIETDSLSLMTEVVEDETKSAPLPSVVLSGPSFADEVARRMPTNLVAASTDKAQALLVQQAVASEWLRVYTSEDPIGVEVGAALKNVIAIAAGAIDGLGLGHNTRAALITRGIAEMARLAMALGGSQLTVAGLSGVGDLILTCTGDLSRNRALGYKLGQGATLAEALEKSRGVAEGYTTAKSAYELGQQNGVAMPIVEAVYSVLYGGSSPKEALKALLARPLHAEWE